MTEREEQIDTETVNSIEETVESEYEYRDFVREERKRFKDESKEDSVDKIDNPKLDKFTGRITEVSFDSQSHHHTITFEDREGKEHTTTVNAESPEDSSNTHVRLCEWLDVDTEYPAELCGNEVPLMKERNLINGNNHTFIDYPPVEKRINPYTYKFRRLWSMGKYYTIHNERPSSSAEYIGKILYTSRPAVGILFSVLTLIWITSALQSPNLFAALLSRLLFFPTAALFAVSSSFGVILYSPLIKRLIAKTGEATHQFIKSSISSAKKFLFPKE